MAEHRPGTGALEALRARVEYRSARALTGLPPSAQVRLSGRPPIRVDGQTLHPEVQLLLALRDRLGTPDVSEQEPAEARERLRRESIAVSGPPAPVGAVRELTVAGGAGSLRARHYAPEEPGGPHPLLVFFHGGGFVLGDLDTHDAPCRLLCRHAGAHVLSVDYRLSPEHRFPAAVDDARAALGWARAHAGELGADPARVAVGGDSAGGNLAAVVAQLAARDGGGAPVAQLLIYPAVDRVAVRPSLELFAEGFVLTRADIAWYHERYTGVPNGYADDPRISPLLADDLSGLAPALVVTAAFDPLRDEGEAYAEALRAAGTPAVTRRVPGLVHGFINVAGVSRAASDALAELAGATRALLRVAVA